MDEVRGIGGVAPDNANRQWWDAVPLQVIYSMLCKYLTDKNLWPWVKIIAAPSHRVADIFTDNPIDVLHIDGCHSELASCRDVQLYLPRVKPGGWVWFDDTNWDTTQKAQHEIECSCRLIVDARDCGGGLKLYRKFD